MINHIIVYTDGIDISEELEYHTFNALNKLEKFIGDNPVDLKTTYSKEGNGFKVHTHGLYDGIHFSAHSIDDDMYNCVDKVSDKLESQLRTAKGKRTNINHDINVEITEE